MPVIGQNSLTFAEIAERLGDEGVGRIIEIMSKQNDILIDLPWLESNLDDAHKSIIRNGLPEVFFRKAYGGVPRSKSKTSTVKDVMGMLEAYSVVDKSVADLGGKTAEVRLSEDVAFMEAFAQKIATTVFYGNTDANEEEFMGLSARYSDMNAGNGENILDAGGTGSDNTSIWIIRWGDLSAHGIYPKGSTAGMNFRNLGEDTVSDGEGKEYQAYRAHFKQDAGLVVKDWRKCLRIANVDVSDLTKDAATGADLVDLISEGLEQIEDGGDGQTFIYCNKKIRTFLRKQMKNSKNVNLSLAESGGKKVLMFDETPVRKVDAILNTESRVL